MKNILDDPQTKLILNVVQKHTGITYEEMNVPSRKRTLALARQIVCFLHNEYTNFTLTKIGVIFNYDHASVIHAKKTISDLLYTEKDFRYEINQMRKDIVKDMKLVTSGYETKDRVFEALLKEMEMDNEKAKSWIDRFTKAL